MRQDAVLRKLGTILSCGALVVLSLSPCLAFAAESANASEKVETITITTDAQGSPEKAEGSITLVNSNEATELFDESELNEIKGKDKASYTESGDLLLWNSDGKDVSYTGVTDKDLPVTITVRYYLDGKSVSAKEIAGKSGEVTIRYDFSNSSAFTATVNGSEVEMYVPFTCITAVMLSGDTFSNVKVTNGKVINDGSDVIVAGYAMPGLKQSLGSLAQDSDVPSFVEITADAKNFELKSTMTIVTAGLLSDLDVDAMGFGDMDGSSAGLKDAMSQLISGSDDLTSGLRELAGGADELASGAQSLSGGLYQLAYGNDGQSGMSSAADNAQKLVDGMATVEENLQKAASGLGTAAQNLETLANALPGGEPTQALIQKVQADADYTEIEKAQIIAGLSAKEPLQQLSAGITQGAQGIMQLSAGYSEIVKNARSLPDGLAQAAAAAKQLYAGSAALSQGASQLSEGMSQAADGSDQLTEGLQTFDEEGISKIVSMIDNDLGGLKNRLKILSDAASAYDNFTGKAPGTPSSVKFVFETPAIEAD